MELRRTEYNRAWRARAVATDPEYHAKLAAKARSWAAAHPERVREIKAASYARHRDERRAEAAERRRTDPEKHREASRRSRLRNLDAARARRRRGALAVYGLTPADYDALLESQGGLCAICRQPEVGGLRLSVDHDHATNRVRALLCRACNVAIGVIENKGLMGELHDYLALHREGGAA